MKFACYVDDDDLQILLDVPEFQFQIQL